jgi:prepilin-type N-terminal cleavage/methylation domain-containing protein
MRRVHGFTLVEILIVVFIIGLIATLPTIAYLRHMNKAMASEAVAAMALIREAERDWHITHNEYINFVSPNLVNLPTDSPRGLGIDIGVAQYFSHHAYWVLGWTSASGTNTVIKDPQPVDFIIYAAGKQSVNVKCGGTVQDDCAIHGDRVKDFKLMMDNTGRIFISYDANATNPHWEPY